jgi:hypothetical protein
MRRLLSTGNVLREAVLKDASRLNSKEKAGNHDAPVTHKLFLTSAILACIASVGWAADAPSGDSKVSIEPRAKPEANRPPTPPANIRVDTTLVLIPITVTDPLNRFVTGLAKENFRLSRKRKSKKLSHSRARTRRCRSVWCSMAAGACRASWRNRGKR